jgi:hypothetical protein
VNADRRLGRTWSQFLQGLPAQPLHIAGISFTEPQPLDAGKPHRGSAVFVWLAPPNESGNGVGRVVYAGMADDVSKWDLDQQRALDRWEDAGHGKAELAMAVHYLPRASKAELMAVEQRLVALLAPTLNERALNDSQAFKATEI